MIRRTLIAALLLVGSAAAVAAVAVADHIPGRPCNGCASHRYWPAIDGRLDKARPSGQKLRGTPRSDVLLGWHGSDILRGGGESDVLWGDHDGSGQPTSQRDRIHGGGGRDFIYGSHGRNVIYGGSGNDAISVHFGRGRVDCGPGRDIYHVARSRRKGYRFRNCEKVDYRSEAQRGGRGLKPLPKR
jgi:hypothetical protein